MAQMKSWSGFRSFTMYNWKCGILLCLFVKFLDNTINIESFYLSFDLFCAEKIVYLHICSVSCSVIANTAHRVPGIYILPFARLHALQRHINWIQPIQIFGATPAKSAKRKQKWQNLAKVSYYSKKGRGPRQVGKIPIFIGPESDLCLYWSQLNPVVRVAPTVEDVKSDLVLWFVMLVSTNPLMMAFWKMAA